MSRREPLWLAAGLAALLAGVIALLDGGILFTRPLWVDEWFTVLVASHASPLDVIADLRRGADGGAGLYHLMVWALGAAGGLSNVLLRALSLVLMWCAMVIVYVTLRRRFGRDASFAGVVALGANVLFVTYAVEGRFYSLWVLCSALFAWSLSLETRRRGVVVAIAAVLLTLSHWYGVITLAIMCAAVVASHERNWKAGLMLIAPAGAGALAFLAVSPLAAGQQSALTVVSWIPDFQPSQIKAFGRGFWFAWPPVVAFFALVVAFIWSRRSAGGPPAMTTTRAAAQDPGLVALFSLTLLPFALAAISIAGRPSMIVRYGLPAMLAWAPWIALAMELVGRWPARAFVVLLLGAWGRNVADEIKVKTEFSSLVAESREMKRMAESLGLPIVYHSLHTMYPLEAPTRGRESRARYLDLPDSTTADLYPKDGPFYHITKGNNIDRDFARVHSRLYGFPTLAPQAVLDTTARFLFQTATDRRPAGMYIIEFALIAFPHHRARQLHPNLLLMELPAARSRPGRSTSR